jgi:hypothetical protein
MSIRYIIAFQLSQIRINKNKKFSELKDIPSNKTRRKPWEKQGREKTLEKTRKKENPRKNKAGRKPWEKPIVQKGRVPP